MVENNNMHEDKLADVQDRISKLQEDKDAFVPEVYQSSFEIDEKLGADYYRSLTKNFEDFCNVFQLDNYYEKLKIIEDDKVGGNYLMKLESDSLVVIFKLKNNFPPVLTTKSSQLDIVVSQSENDNLPNKFNLRFTDTLQENTFKINTCTVITLEEAKLKIVEQKAKFWITMSTL